MQFGQVWIDRSVGLSEAKSGPGLKRQESRSLLAFSPAACRSIRHRFGRTMKAMKAIKPSIINNRSFIHSRAPLSTRWRRWRWVAGRGSREGAADRPFIDNTFPNIGKEWEGNEGKRQRANGTLGHCLLERAAQSSRQRRLWCPSPRTSKVPW